MSASREGFNLMHKAGRAHFRAAAKRGRIPWHYVWEDTFLIVACWFVGHATYNAADAGDAPEWACRRCHRYIRKQPTQPEPPQ